MENEQKKTILIVADVKGNVVILSQILQASYRTIFAFNSEKALEISHKQQPDLILLDIMMPDIDGYQVCQQLKSSPKTAQIPVIFISAKNEEEDELQGLKYGACDYIAKPFNADIVRLRVSVHLDLEQHKQNEQQLIVENNFKTQFLSRMSHELRTPLNTILGFSELLKMDELHSDQLDSVVEIYNAGSNMLHCIDNIILLSNLNSGIETPQYDDFWLDKFIDDLIKPLALVLNKQQIQLQNKLLEHDKIQLKSDKKLGSS